MIRSSHDGNFSSTCTMFVPTSFLLLAGLASAVTLSKRQQADSSGYILPDSGTASTTQFNIGSELGSGTSCGATSLADGSMAGGAPGGGPGFLYAAINQLGFGANPGRTSMPCSLFSSRLTLLLC